MLRMNQPFGSTDSTTQNPNLLDFVEKLGVFRLLQTHILCGIHHGMLLHNPLMSNLSRHTSILMGQLQKDFKKLSSAERISFLARPLGAPLIKLPSSSRAEILSIQKVSDEIQGIRKLTGLVAAFAAKGLIELNTIAESIKIFKLFTVEA